MQLLQTFDNSPANFNKYYSPRGRIQNAATYEQYFEKKLKQKQAQRQKNVSPSVKSKNLKSKSKVSKIKQGRSAISQKKTKKSPKDYQIDPMYASRISAMLSQISIPSFDNKATKQQLNQLEQKIMTGILSLRQEKIMALQNLNKIIDKKNKAIELKKGLEVLKEAEKLNTEESSGEEDQNLNPRVNHDKYSSHPSRVSARYNQSRVSKRSNNAAELMKSKISNEVNQIEEAYAQASKIRQQLMKPLAEHPLLLKNAELRAQLQQLQRQLAESSNSRSNIAEEISHYKQENEKLVSELQKQRSKLSSIEHKRFQTFFPKDRQKIDQVKRLIEVQRQLQNKKEELQNEILNGTIIRRAEDQILIEELKQENRLLLIDCQNLARKYSPSGEYEDGQYAQMSLHELQELFSRQMENKAIFDQILTQFKSKIGNLERQNETLRKKRNNRTSYFY